MVEDKHQEFAHNVAVQWCRLYMLTSVLSTTSFGGHADKAVTSFYAVTKVLYDLLMCVVYSDA